MRLLYVSGSSAGHLAPLVAVERAVKTLEPTSESLFVCSQTEDDAVFLSNAGVPYKPLPLPRRPSHHPIAFIRSFKTARAIIDEFRPDAVFSKGGIVSIPICYVAHKKKIPIILHESDAVMGRANRIVAKWATHICVGFPIDRRDVRIGRLYTVTGNPIRPEITQGNREEGLKITSLLGTRPILLVIGGSQGAQALNEAVIRHLDELLRVVDIVHVTGRGKKKEIERPGYWSIEFAHGELPHLFAIADMALSRSGAGSITELASCGIPAILVPIEGLANDHQVKNATVAQSNGACIILLQRNLGRDLVEVIRDLAENSQRINEISQSMRPLFQPDAALQIARTIVQTVAQKGRSH